MMTWYKTSANYYKTILYPKIDTTQMPLITIGQIAHTLKDLPNNIGWDELFSPARVDISFLSPSEKPTGELLATCHNAWVKMTTEQQKKETAEKIKSKWQNGIQKLLNQYELTFDITLTEIDIHIPKLVFHINITDNEAHINSKIDEIFGKKNFFLEIPSFVLNRISPNKNKQGLTWNSRIVLNELLLDAEDENLPQTDPDYVKYIPQLIQFVQQCYDNNIDEIVVQNVQYGQEKEDYPQDWIQATANIIARRHKFNNLPEWAEDIMSSEFTKKEPNPIIKQALLDSMKLGYGLEDNFYPQELRSILIGWAADQLESENPPQELLDFISFQMRNGRQPPPWALFQVGTQLLNKTAPQPWIDFYNHISNINQLPEIGDFAKWAQKHLLEEEPEGWLRQLAFKMHRNLALPLWSYPWMQQKLDQSTGQHGDTPNDPDSIEETIRTKVLSDINGNAEPQPWAIPWLKKQLENTDSKTSDEIKTSILSTYDKLDYVPDYAEDFVLKTLIENPNELWSSTLRAVMTSKFLAGKIGMDNLLYFEKRYQQLEENPQQLNAPILSPTTATNAITKIDEELEKQLEMWGEAGSRSEWVIRLKQLRQKIANSLKKTATSNSWYK